MFGLGLGTLLVVRGCRRALRDEQFRASASALLVLMAASTIFYSWHEDWSVLNALYFSVVSLTTVGFGDITPTTSAGKIYTIFFLVLGIGMGVAFVTSLGSALVAERHEAITKRAAKSAAAKAAAANSPTTPTVE